MTYSQLFNMNKHINMALFHIRKRPLTFFIIFSIICLGVSLQFVALGKEQPESVHFWNFQAIDTMKYSRDLAREKLKDSTFDVVIEQQIKQIADTGATHVAIATPYDEEFLPFLKRWVKYARQYNLKIWFRGNFSGWERWFEYDKIDRAKHMELTKQFILNNPSLFVFVDKFSACPECENGGPGDPRLNGDSSGHKTFLIEEYKTTKAAFKTLGVKVESNYNSMNGDVAKIIMDRATTKQLDNLVVIDHYVKDPEKLSQDITNYARQSGGKVILGEFGAPIPDIHGDFSQIEQKEWLEKTLQILSTNDQLIGLSYWTNTGGSTQLWEQSGVRRAAVDSLAAAYNPYTIKGVVVNVFNKKIIPVRIFSDDGKVTTASGEFSVPSFTKNKLVRIQADGYKPETIELSGTNKVVLRSLTPGLVEKILYFLTHFSVSK